VAVYISVTVVTCTNVASNATDTDIVTDERLKLTTTPPVIPDVVVKSPATVQFVWFPVNSAAMPDVTEKAAPVMLALRIGEAANEPVAAKAAVTC
jgi:hypothetical protein